MELQAVTPIAEMSRVSGVGYTIDIQCSAKQMHAGSSRTRPDGGGDTKFAAPEQPPWWIPCCSALQL